MIRARAPRRAAAGFTLMETLVAMTILSIALAIVFQQFSGALNAAYVSEAYTRAVWHAREKMDELLLRDAPGPGEEEGDFGDGYRWRCRVEAVELDAPPAPDAVAPLTITVWVNWEQGRNTKELELSALTLAVPPGT
jgi:general secretion pathway protein I